MSILERVGLLESAALILVMSLIKG